MIYHIATKEEWEDQGAAAVYAPSSYAKEQFIHCSDLHQLESVANRYFPGREDLVILELMPTKLEPQTRYEQSGLEKYPHVYGPVNKDAINREMSVQCNADGRFDGVFSKL